MDEDHDPSDYNAAVDLINKGGVPLGLIFKKAPPTSNDLQIK